MRTSYSALTAARQDTSTPRPNMAAPYSSDEKATGHHEAIAGARDEDSSSGNVDTVEKAVAPGADAMAVDKITERAVLRKLDYRIVPMVMWVYLMNMMDRGEFWISYIP